MGRIGIFLLLIFSLDFSQVYPESRILDFNLIGYSKEGALSWEIKGKSADVSSDNVKLEDLEAVFYEKEKITLTSKEGIFFRNKDLIRLEKDVRLITDSGSILKTGSLDYNGKQKILSSSDFVDIQRQKLSIKGVGLEAKPDLKDAKIIKDVVLEVVEVNPEKRKIQISCDGPLQIDYDKRIAIFNKSVKVEDMEGEITSDTMEVYFDSSVEEKEGDVSGWKIDKIIAKGNVKIVRGENVSYGEEAIYDAKKKKVTLKGSPKLIIYSEEKINLP